MTDRTSLALLKFLGIDPSCTQKVVLVLEKGDLPRVRITSIVKPAPGAEAGLVRQVRDFDMVPHDETRAQRDELEKLRADLSEEVSRTFEIPCRFLGADVGVMPSSADERAIAEAAASLSDFYAFPRAASITCPHCKAVVREGEGYSTGHLLDCPIFKAD